MTTVVLDVVRDSPRAYRKRRRRPGDLKWLVLISALGALLRVFPVRGIWLDEAISVAQARLPYPTMLHQLMYGDLHPPLWGSVLWADVRIFGYSPLALRIPSIVAGTLCIPLLYLLGRELFDRRTGIAAAVLLAAAPLAVWYSGEARMYAFYLLFAIVALLGQARAIRRGDRAGWVLFVAGSAALIYTHYFSVLQLAAQHLVFLGLALRDRRLRKQWLISIAVIAVVLLPLVPYVLQQLGNASSPGASPTEGTGQPVSLYTVLANLVWSLWGYHSNALMTQLVALWPVAMLLVLALLGKGRSWAVTLLVAAVAGPVLGAFVISIKAETFFEVRYFVSILPPLIVLVARAATGWLPSFPARAVAVGALALTMLAGLADEQFDPANPRLYDYGGAFQYVSAQSRPGDQIVFAPDYLDVVVGYYHPAQPATPLSDQRPFEPSPGRVLVLASFLDQPATAALVGGTLSTLERNGRSIRQTKHWENVTLWILE
ncbi:MAG TPA: glycosyltransferase family 39 protein [Actinoplanes sp.]